MTPQLRPDDRRPSCCLIDLGAGRNRLGGVGAGAGVESGGRRRARSGRARGGWSAFFDVIQSCLADGLLARVSRSLGRRAVRDARGDGVCGSLRARHRHQRARRRSAGRACSAKNSAPSSRCARRIVGRGASRGSQAAGLGGMTHAIGRAVPGADDSHRPRRRRVSIAASRVDLHRAWAELSYTMQSLRDNPDCARQEYDALLDADAPGAVRVADLRAVRRRRGAVHRDGRRGRASAILREQGVNGQYEMAAAFTRAGFDAFDVHMSDMLAGRVDLADVQGAGGVRRVLLRRRAGRRGGLGQDDPVPRARARSVRRVLRAARYVHAGHLQRLPDAVEPARDHPGRGALAALRAQRVGAVRGARRPGARRASPSVLLAGMDGSRCRSSWRTARARPSSGRDASARRDSRRTAASRCDTSTRAGRPTQTLSRRIRTDRRARIAAVCSDDGRVTITMPHPERVFRTVQNSWAPPEWGEDGGWMRLFRNARVWLG